MRWKPTDQTGETKTVAIHAALVVTPTAPRIVYFGWSHQKTFLYDATPGAEDNTRMDVLLGNPIKSQNLGRMFCGSESFLADGRLFVGGGVVDQGVDHDGHAHASGERTCYIYSPIANAWTKDGEIADMRFQPGSDEKGGGRWYPTIITLGNGTPFATGGHPFIGRRDDKGVLDKTGADDSRFPNASGPPRHNNNTPERYSLVANKWTLLVNESTAYNDQGIDEYPRVHLAPSGFVFFSTRAKQDKRFYNPENGAYTNDCVKPGRDEYINGSESTSVLLPILPDDLDNIWVLALGGKRAQRINIAADEPVWIDSGEGGKPIRNHACSVLLPTGQVFLTGGVGDAVAANPEDSTVVPKRASAFLAPEIYTPPINSEFTSYDQKAADAWTTGPLATVVRGYHSSALLLPDGRVWTAGSTDAAGASKATPVFWDHDKNPDTPKINTYPDGSQIVDFQSISEQRIEIFEPDYFAVPNRMVIGNDVPASVGYGMEVKFTVTSGTPVRVALLRCGAMTHALDSDQRYVVLKFTLAGTTVTATIPTLPNILPPGMYMLWVIDKNGNPCHEAKFIRVCDQAVRFDVNRSTFSRDETKAKQDANGVTTFDEILHAHFECFRPSELDFPNTDPSTQLSWHSTSGEPIDSKLMALSLKRTIVEDPSLPPDVAQRITFVYNLVVKDIVVFDKLTGTDGEFNARVGIDRFFADTRLGLTTDPNPYMIDVEGGNPHYLSADLRVFNIKPGDSKFGDRVKFDTGDSPLEFLSSLLKQLKGEAAKGSNATFGALPRDQQDPDGVMELSQLVDGQLVQGMIFGGTPIFNFAIAKVRYVSQSTSINNVKVFFRLFNTVGTALEYNSDTTYRRDGSGASTIPLLGKVGPVIISIPCFATARLTPLLGMDEQHDPENTQPMEAKGAEESIAYFGCWLDINQTVQHIPLIPFDDGPYPSLPFPLGPLSIQDLVRNHHQCLVAELFFGPDKIPDIADPTNSAPAGTPANHENLAQRNLAISKSGNPGSAASRTVQTTFVAKPTNGATTAYLQSYVSPDRRQPFDLRRRRVQLPDELMLVSYDLPAGSKVTLYSPDLDADLILRLASQRSSPIVLTAVDAHTIRFELRQAAYIPLPGDIARNVVGLLSVELPPGVTKGQVYTLHAHQYSGNTRRKLIGSFLLRIPVEAEASLLFEEIRKLSVLRKIFKAIPMNDPWHPVFVRYLGQIEDRVRAFGGDPDLVIPSPSGSLPTPRPDDDQFVEGKVSRVEYNCFGDFEGFELETCKARRRFKSCEKKIEELVLRACKERCILRVLAQRDDPHRIAAISIVCC